ncbi:MAG: SOS-response transcriptional repressor LexA, partial [Pseudoalteromonas tetraodonis]
LVQAEGAIRRALDESWPETNVSWYLGGDSDLGGDLVIASIQKLSRPDGLKKLEDIEFDYAIIDEVHHAQAPSYRKVLARLRATFTLGLTATPERTDGVDVASLFDDILAWHATIGDGIEEGSLVPFHYIGLTDEVDFQQIPWRNGRFDPGVLEEKVENSARMEKLWQAWQEHPAQRTVVFCCSQRHALFTRDWLRARGVRTAAVFAGSGSDARGDSVEALMSGKLEALCVVDLFNEGVDLPSVDRVVMLRPTESKVIFIQQLGRGLRAAENKSRLLVLDFIGNHRLFGQRLLHLLSLRGVAVQWDGLRRWLDQKRGAPDLPPECLLDVELEAKDLLRQILPRGGGAAIDAYRAMRDELGRRPTMAELFHRGYLPSSIRAAHEHWFNFVLSESDLKPDEAEVLVLDRAPRWLRMLELTTLNKSFKMVVIRVLLDRDALWEGMAIGDLSAACRAYLRAHPQLKEDLAPNKQIPDHASVSDADWAAWWLAWPLDRWLAKQAGQVWFSLDGDRFAIALRMPVEQREVFELMTAEVVDFRIAKYVAAKNLAGATSEAGGFEAKVSHSGGRPILFLPTKEKSPGRPVGPTEVALPDGSLWVFRFVKVACNVAHPKGEDDNQLGPLLQGWFGTDAGAPGTGFHVKFHHDGTAWNVEPLGSAAREGATVPQPSSEDPVLFGELAVEQDPPAEDRHVRCVPAYSLEAAAGAWGPDQEPEVIGWTPVEGTSLKEGMFAARVDGHSMEPKIPSGSWCLFRQCPPGSREGKILLIQLHTMTDPEDGGRYTIKKYRSDKSADEDGSWAHRRIELQPINRDYDPIEITEEHEARELKVVGEFVRVLT